MPTRNATAVWEGGLKDGKGSFKGESGAVQAPYSFFTRFENQPGTNPEELLAAAEAACYSMALSANLEKAGKKAVKVETRAGCVLEKLEAGWTVTGIKLAVRATVPGIDKEEFAKIADATKAGCPVSRALAAVKIDLDAQLA